jgi:hypothetical protein
VLGSNALRRTLCLEERGSNREMWLEVYCLRDLTICTGFLGLLRWLKKHNMNWICHTHGGRME